MVLFDSRGPKGDRQMDFDFPYERTAMTYEKPSVFRRWIDKMTGTERGLSRAHASVSETALAIRQVGEGVVVGAALGAAQAKLAGGLDIKGIPLDAAVGGLAIVGGIALADEPIAHDLRNVGTGCATIFAFRKTADFLAVKKVAATITGERRADIGAEDPILSMAHKFQSSAP
jgi:hypothetical protein